jgi:lipopolysaccharide export system protein LptA
MATAAQARARIRSVARLRRWLAAGAILLVIILGGLLSYAHYKAKRLIANLPHQLGIDIKSETNNFTWSQSIKGRTLFTLHAAKAIQRENGKATLHDVNITIFGPVGSNRQDNIQGAEFEYDQPNGVVRATGDVHLDLASPSQEAAAKPGAKRIIVVTSGLIFLQKLGIAATDQPLHFIYGDMKGGATGADYETDTGILRLRSAVTADGTQNGQLVHIRATAAEIDRNTEIANLTNAHITSDDNIASGDNVQLQIAKGGGVQAVEAQGNTSLESSTGIKAQAPHMHARMTPQGKLENVLMTGGVQLQDAGGTGSSNQATLHFNPAGLPLQAVLDGAVKLSQTANNGALNTVTAPHLVAGLMQDATQHTQLRQAVATGGAVLHSVAPKTLPNGKTVSQTTILHADTLHAATEADGKQRYISQLDGAGSTRVEQDDGAGNLRTSSGDTLQAKLAAPGHAPKKPGTGAGTLQSAVQTGHVVVTQHTAAANGKPAQDSRATATRADFDQVTNKLVLTGSPQVTGPGLQMAADRIVMAQTGGDAEATGSVNGTYVQDNTNGKPAEPVHVLADHATVAGGGASAIFYGGSKPARMWTSTSQMDAPVIETERTTGRLFAHGNSPADRIHLALPQAQPKPKPQIDTSAQAQTTPPAPPKSQAKPAGKLESAAGVVRITGGTLTYLPAEGTKLAHADIAGGVRMDTPDSELTASDAVATLQSSGAPGNGARAQPGMMAGNIETILATGSVRLQQPGRIATGERLLYTAAGQRYDLTGTTAAPPRVVDSLKGTTTGAALIFHGGDDSVEVVGEPGRRVRTETQTAHPSRSK